MEYYVDLKQIPTGLSFPKRLEDRVLIDTSRGRFGYRGFMTKCTYDELAALSDNPEYRRALEQLFVLTAAEMSPTQSRAGFPRAIVVAAISTAAIAGAAVWMLTQHGAAAKPG